MPSLPQNDTPENQANRKAQLENKQKQYVFDPEYLPPLTVIKDVPITESFSPKYLAERLPSTLGKLSANSLAIKVKSHWDPLDELQDYEDFYPVLPPPSVMRTYHMDESFAEQRLSGSNPMVLQGKSRNCLPLFLIACKKYKQPTAPKFQWNKVWVRNSPPVISMWPTIKVFPLFREEPTSKAKNIFLLPSPYSCGVNLVIAIKAQLMPVAIQIDSIPGQKAALLTPNSLGNNWLYAKTCVQIADANHHEMASHLCHTHLVMEPFAVSTARRLSAIHPLYLLLRPHFRFMLFNNEMARKRLVNKAVLWMIYWRERLVNLYKL